MRYFFDVRFCLRFWCVFGPILGPFWDPKWVILGVVFWPFFGRRPSGAPRVPQEAPRGSKKAPQEAPRGAHEASRAPKKVPKRPQEAPRGLKRSQKARGREKRSIQKGSRNTICNRYRKRNRATLRRRKGQRLSVSISDELPCLSLSSACHDKPT